MRGKSKEDFTFLQVKNSSNKLGSKMDHDQCRLIVEFIRRNAVYFVST